MSQCLSDESVLAFVGGTLPVDRIDELHEHIDGCSACRQLVAETARAGFGPEAMNTAGVVGRTVDRFRVQRVIGVGGMGVVYLAEDTALQRNVALKFLRTDDRERLLREARAMAQLAHPNVVAVFEAGTFGEQLYIAMEYVDGVTLREWLAAAPRTWTQITGTLLDAARGLAAAHAAGLVHRDVKPENVLVGKDGRTRVTDFGLARPATADAVTQVAGTPRYMAPEQLAGEPGDARADQYSFCVTLHEALFRDRTTGAPEAIRRVLERGMERDPAARHASMTELIERLSPRRSRAPIAAAAALAALGATALVLKLATSAAPSARPAACSPPPSPECAADEYCAWSAGNACGAAGEPGTCTLRPDAAKCPIANQPVCGCDGKTYASVCFARAAGTGWDYHGACRVCSTDPDGDHCTEHQLCSFPAGDPCGEGHSVGVCRVRASDCKRGEAPVCGCDGKTYRTICVAHEAGVNARHAGSCP